MFKRATGKPNFEYYPKVASTALSVGEVGQFDGSGAVTVANATSVDNVGVIMKDVTSADADYADNTKIPVDMPDKNDIFEADVDGTLTTAMVGGLYDLNADGDAVDVTSTAVGQVLIVGFISASKALIKFVDLQVDQS